MSCCQYASYAFDPRYTCARCVLRSRAMASAMQAIRRDPALNHKPPAVTLNGMLRAYVKPHLQCHLSQRSLEISLAKVLAPQKMSGKYYLIKAKLPVCP